MVNKENPGTLFDRAVEYTNRTGQRTAQRGIKRLAVDMEPHVRAEPGVPRRLDLVSPGLRRVFRRLVSGEAPWPLYLFGDVGSGKTAAVLCLCDHVRESYYRTVARLADDRMARGNDMETVAKKRLAVLDEIGARKEAGDLIYGIVKDFADCREPRSHVAVYVSNLHARNLAEMFDDRVVDRLTCGTVFRLEGQSRRHEQ